MYVLCSFFKFHSLILNTRTLYKTTHKSYFVFIKYVTLLKFCRFTFSQRPWCEIDTILSTDPAPPTTGTQRIKKKTDVMKENPNVMEPPENHVRVLHQPTPEPHDPRKTKGIGKKYILFFLTKGVKSLRALTH